MSNGPDEAGKVVQLDAYRPHLVLSAADRSVHVVAVGLVESVIDGRVPVADLDPRVVRAMLLDYLTMLQDEHNP